MSAYSNSADDNGRNCYRWRSARASWHPVELIAMILGFMIFWPIGLAILGLKMWQRKSGEPGDLATAARSAWAKGEDYAQGFGRNWAARGPAWAQPAAGGFGGMGRTGNSAFDEWRASELSKLEEERKRLANAEREFADHIEGLRRSRDREEFERFMAARNNVSRTGPEGGA